MLQKKEKKKKGEKGSEWLLGFDNKGLIVALAKAVSITGLW